MLAARVLRSRSVHRLPALYTVHIHTSNIRRAMATTESLNQEIAQQSTLFNELRQQNADASLIEAAKQKLGDLKRSLGALTKAAGGDKDTKKKERLLLKTAKVRGRTRSRPSFGCSRVTHSGYAGLWPRRDVLQGTRRAHREGLLREVWRGLSRHACV